MQLLKYAFLLLVLFNVGCASIVTGHNQSISVETKSRGTPVMGASCKLTNDKGTWFVQTPGSVTVHRSYNDMLVECQKEGFTPVSFKSASTTKGMVAGNILFGGLIGTGIDMASGAAYDYPDLITADFAMLGSVQSNPNGTTTTVSNGNPPRVSCRHYKTDQDGRLTGTCQSE